LVILADTRNSTTSMTAAIAAVALASVAIW
jgi:hypothetical protein